MSKKKGKTNPLPELPVQRIPIFDKGFREDVAWWFKADQAKANKILDLVSNVMSNPFTGIGKPEPIKYLESDTWSRRIDLERRLVYRVRHDRIDFLACRYHYE
ncbi:Txe/YoeB family addiction module toxin [Synechococcales cyanobacterium C]|uniref:Endoribonuclease YoeB n=1 Tax=Petrachloros mirabilis ULC683 TaxID=2781853 RepID=A0A8K1ZWB7_9CYAN|nr:Txe/YoeB family addiction module toxin [Petrachloros mirabilis]NCJ06435.1 Txe/YoeB family addiction module toxin [Petrachloros mirabilis ULC683]